MYYFQEIEFYLQLPRATVLNKGTGISEVLLFENK